MPIRGRILILATALTTAVLPVRAATNTWDADTGSLGAQDGSGIWIEDAANTNWWDGAANVSWSGTAQDSAIIGSGSGAAGTLTLGSPITVGNLRFDAPGSGSYTIDGNGFALTFGIDDPVLWVSSGVTATNRADSLSDTRDLHLTGGGTLVLAGTNSFDSVDMADASTNYNGIAGVAGTTLTIPAGARLTTDGTTPGSFTAGFRLRDNATLNVDGTLISAGTMGGYTSEDHYTINVNPGAVISNNSSLILGWNATGTLNVNGGTVTVNGTVYHMDGNDGSAVNLNGGTLATGNVRNESGNGLFWVNFNGGTLKALGTSLFTESSDKSYTATLRMLDGGAVIDSNGKSVETPLPLALIGSGGLTKQGAGTLTFSGGTYTGATVVTAGTLNLSFNKRAASAAWGSVCDYINRKSRLVLNGGNLTVTGRGAASSVSKTFTVGGASYYSLCARSGNTSGLVAGMPVSGSYIPTNTYIACIKDSTHLLLSAAATNSTAGAVSLTFGAVNDTTWQTLRDVELLQDATVTVDGNGGPGTTLALCGVTGDGGLTKAGSGTLALSGTTTYIGATAIQAGTLLLTRPESADAVTNASFETHATLANSGTWSYSPGGAAWTFSSAGIAAPGSPWIDASAPIDGGYAGFVQNNGYMSVNFTAPASGTCVIAFLAGTRPGYPASALSLEIDGSSKLSVPSATFSRLGDTFTTTTVLAAGSHTLTIRGTQLGSDSATWFDRIGITYLGQGGLANILPVGSEVAVAAGAVLDLNGHTQTVTRLSGGGLITNGTLTVSGRIEPGGTNAVGTLTVASSATLSGTLVADVAADGSCDTLAAPDALDLSGLSLQVQDTGLLTPHRTYVIARCAPDGLTGRFKTTNLDAGQFWRVVYDSADGEVRLELMRGTLITLH